MQQCACGCGRPLAEYWLSWLWGGVQVQLMAVMVTQFPIRLAVYDQQVEDMVAHRVSSGGGNKEEDNADRR